MNVILSVSLYRMLSVQLVYSVQLNCTENNFTDTAATCSTAQHIYRTYSVQTVESATKLYLR